MSNLFHLKKSKRAMDDCASFHSNIEVDCTLLVHEQEAGDGHGVQPLPTMTRISNGVFVQVSVITISIFTITILIKKLVKKTSFVMHLRKTI